MNLKSVRRACGDAFALMATACILTSFLPSNVFAARIAMFADPAFVDLTVGGDGEAPNLQASLQGLGHVVTPFTGITTLSWTSALASADVLVIPELEVAELASALSDSANSAIAGYVLSGGGLIMAGEAFRAGQVFNRLFGWALASGGVSGASSISAPAAAGTPYEGGLAAISSPSAVTGFTNASKPPGSLAIYVNGSSMTVMATTVAGAGRAVFLGYDWFGASTPTDWVSVLGSSVTFAAGASPKIATIAYFNDPNYIDSPEEGALLLSSLHSLGQTIVEFTGVAESDWRTATLKADVIVIPEMENGNLFVDLSGGARSAITEFVLSGGGLILTDGSSLQAILLNGLFGYAIAAGSGGVSTLNTGAAAGTAFATGPPTLPSSDATEGMTSASLPAGSKNLYTFGTNSVVFAVGRGWGRIVSLGFDWFENPTPTPWLTVLSCAVQHAASGPPVIVTPPSTNPGAPALITADLSGFVGLTTANLRFRAGGDAGFLSAPLTNTGPTTWTATIPGTQVSAKGVQFFVEANAGSIVGFAPLHAPSRRAFSLPVRVTGHQVLSLGAGGYQLAGLQVRADDANPEAVFDELGSYDNTKWRYGTFDPSSGSYQEPNSAAAAVSGRGFWITSKNAANIAVTGTSADLSQELSITLRQGWNQIANPFGFPVDFADVVLPAEVEANLVGFNGSGYVTNVGTLQPGAGYWIKNNGPGDRVIEIPPLGSGVAPLRPAPRVASESEVAWSVRVEAFTTGAYDRENWIGMRANALEGRDEFDRSDPPVPPAGWVNVSLEAKDGSHLFADWRSDSDGTGASWQIVFASDRSGEPFGVDFVTERGLPAGWKIAAFEGAREVELGADARIAGIVPSQERQLRWTVTVGNEAYLDRVREDVKSTVTMVSLGRPFPNPSRGDVTFDLALPNDLRAVVQVFDVQGRLVKSLANGEFARGVRRVRWDGSGDDGKPTAAGVYFVRLTAGPEVRIEKLVLLR